MTNEGNIDDGDIKVYRMGEGVRIKNFENVVELKNLVEDRVGVAGEFQGSRMRMEDMVLVVPKFLDDFSLLAIFDGHGGKMVAELVKDNTAEILKRQLEINNYDFKQSFEGMVSKLEQKIEEDNTLDRMGTTGVWVLMGKDKLIVCNLGDTEAVVVGKGLAKVITIKHNWLKETQRVALGLVVKGRLEVGDGSISVSRSLGDKYFGKQLIISDPNIDEIELKNEDEYLILASDGLWDKVDYIKAGKISESEKYPKKIVEKLKNLALENGSKDNISIMVIKLK